MPLASVVGARPITVQFVEVVFWVTPYDVIVGDPVSFAGRVMVDGEGVPDGTRVDISLVAPDGTLLYVAWAETESHDPYGSGFFGYNPPYSVTPIGWTVPDTFNAYKLPCSTWEFAAVSLGQRDVGGATIRVAYPVRIRNLIAPETAPANFPFSFSGFLEYQDAGVWKGLDSRTTTLSYNGTVLGSVTTGVDGYFEKTDCVIPSTGTFTLAAEFGGAPSLRLAPITAFAEPNLLTMGGILTVASLLAFVLRR